MKNLQRLLYAFAVLAVLCCSALLSAREVIQASYQMVKINVPDIDRSIEFYQNVIGLKETGRVGGGGAGHVEVMLSQSGKPFESQIVLVEEKHRLDMGTAYRNLVFVVTDIRAVLARAQATGLTITKAPAERKTSELGFASSAIIGFLKDPDGYSIELIQWNK